jgi:predicted secreted protein
MMKRIVTVLSAALLLAISPHSPVFTQSDATAGITVRAGEEFFIALKSTPSTGYAWAANGGDPKILAYEGNVMQNPDANVPGAPGQQIFIYHANRTGTTQITLTYARPFDTSAPGQTLVFSVTVQ